MGHVHRQKDMQPHLVALRQRRPHRQSLAEARVADTWVYFVVVVVVRLVWVYGFPVYQPSLGWS